MTSRSSGRSDYSGNRGAASLPLVPPTLQRKRLLVAVVIAAQVIIYAALIRLWTPIPFFHDNLALGLPYRRLISLSVREGHLPLWDHWSGAGAPIVSLYTPTALSPIVLLQSIGGVYGPNAFKIELLIIFSLGAVGMYKWLSLLAGTIPALVAATAYQLSPFFIVQSVLNLETAASAALYPWIGVAIVLALRGDLLAVPLGAAAVYLTTTLGYLGSTVLSAPVLAVGCVAMALLATRGARQPFGGIGRRLRALGLRPWVLMASALTLGLALVNFIILETITNFDADLFLGREINPFNGSARLQTAFTTFGYHMDSPFPAISPWGWTDERLLGVGVIYVGAIGLIGLVAGAWWRNAGTICALVFAGVAFLMTLEPNPATEWLVRNAPGFADVRYKGFLLQLVAFFLLTGATFGLRRLLSRHTRRDLAIVAGIGLGMILVVGWRFASQSTTWRLDAVIAVAFFVVSTVLIATLHRGGRGRLAIGALLVAVAAQAATFYILLPTTVPNGQPNPLVATDAEAQARIDEFIDSVARSSFDPAIPSATTRITDQGWPVIDGLVWALNEQYYSLEPIVNTYQPQMKSVVRRAVEEDRVGEFTPMFRDAGNPNLEPLVVLDELNPSALRAQITLSAPTDDLVWVSPYSRNWRLYVDGEPRGMSASDDGLHRFALGPGTHDVELEYRPAYLLPSVLITLGALLVCVGMTIFTIRRRSVHGRHQPGRSPTRVSASESREHTS